MTVSTGLFSALILTALVLVVVAPLILISLWLFEWKRGTLW